MQHDEFWSGKLAEMVDLIERQERGVALPGQSFAEHWLADLKREVEAKKLAEAQAQYRRDALMTRLMFELNRVRAVELLEEMNRELLEREGRVEPVYTSRHELCLSWAAPGGRNMIRVGAEANEETGEVYLLITGQEERKLPASEDALKNALVEAFRQPHFDVYRW